MSLRTYIPRSSHLGELLRLALPVAIVQVGLTAMGAVDTAMVGRVSPTDLAAVGLGNLYFFGIAIFGMGMLFVLDPVVSQAVGARDRDAVARAVQRGGILALALAILASAALLGTGTFLNWVGQPADVVPVAGAYAVALIPGMFPFYAFIVLRQSLQAMGFVRPVLFTVVLANLGNVFLNWILVFGNLGSPALGAVGSSWGTSIARWFMLLTVLVLAWRQLRHALLPLRRSALLALPLWRLIRVGAPVGGHHWLEFGVFAAAGLMVGLLGTVAVAAHQVAIQIAALTFMVPVGVAQAAGVLVGRSVGRRDARGSRRAAGAGLLAGSGFMCLTAALFISLPEELAGLFAADPAVVAAAALLMPIAGVFQVLDGVQVVAAGALRGLADTRVPMLISLVAFWGCGLPVSYLLGFHWGGGATGVWWGLVTGLGFNAVLLVIRMRIRFAKVPRRVVIDDSDRRRSLAHGDPETSRPPPT